jgi:CHC2 zinc finger/Toprim domain
MTRTTPSTTTNDAGTSRAVHTDGAATSMTRRAEANGRSVSRLRGAVGSSFGLIAPHIIEAFRAALPPSEVISKYVKLRKAGREMKGLSPFNKEHTPSFFVNDAKQLWHCFSSNQGGDVFAFLMKMEGMTFREAAQRCAAMAGISIPDGANAVAPLSGEELAKAAAEREELRRAELEQEAACEIRMGNLARSIARDSRAFKLGDGSPPALFLESRGLEMMHGVSPRALLYHARCPFRDDAGNEVVHHALIGIYRDVVTDKVKAISRRPLTRDGGSLSKPISLGPARGCAIKLTADEDVTQGLHLAEGVTSALAAAMLGMVPVWACGGTRNMAKFPVLVGIDSLTLIADNDQSGAGQTAANQCFDRWSSAGKEVWNVISTTAGTDLADVVIGREEDAL